MLFRQLCLSAELCQGQHHEEFLTLLCFIAICNSFINIIHCNNNLAAADIAGFFCKVSCQHKTVCFFTDRSHCNSSTFGQSCLCYSCSLRHINNFHRCICTANFYCCIMGIHNSKICCICSCYTGSINLARFQFATVECAAPARTVATAATACDCCYSDCIGSCHSLIAVGFCSYGNGRNTFIYPFDGHFAIFHGYGSNICIAAHCCNHSIFLQKLSL